MDFPTFYFTLLSYAAITGLVYLITALLLGFILLPIRMFTSKL